MSAIAEAVRHMMKAGMDADAIADAVSAMETATILSDPRTPRQKRNARYYASKASEKRLNRLNQDVSDADPLSPKKEIPPTPPKEKTTPIHPKANAFGTDRDFFSEFWLAYPRREGSNPRKPAKLTFDRLVAKGVDPERLIAAAKALAVEHPTPTRFVPQAVTFLNQERFADAEPVIPGDTFCAADDPQTRWHVIRYHDEHDGADPPPAAYGGKAGYMIPATWVKAMQMRQANG